MVFEFRYYASSLGKFAQRSACFQYAVHESRSIGRRVAVYILSSNIKIFFSRVSVVFWINERVT